MIMENDKATVEWLNSQKKATMYSYNYSWQFFLEFTGLTGDKILESRKADKEYAWERKTLEFKTWLIQKGKSEHTAVSATTAVRSFFAFYRLPLDFSRTQKARLTEATRKTEDYLFNREDLKKMFDVGDLEERYVLTAGKSFGLRAGDFLRLTRGDLQPYLNRETPISIRQYTTQKERIKAYPFIDSDALPVIKLMIEKMDRQGRRNSKDRILTFSDEAQLSRVLKRLVEKAGLNVGNKTVRFHNLHKFLIDRISSVMSESKWKQVVGKKISEGAYVSPESLRQDYSRATPETCFTALDLNYIRQRQEAAEAITDKLLRKEQLSDEDIGNIKRYGIKLAQKTSRRTQTNGGDCGLQFEQINEAQLLQYLKAGWQIVHRLSDGQVIVKR